ncbi:hypothetical protein QBC38DRAFT_536502 [Podospora fimiseda]|uniref:SNARE-complex protein Syntaxin-18 N-terminal domain-containing protein n=1 Tax=Podospora fimiseda TaxID=252190 RepID=A0AAN7GYX9_9PEZI|nr:hypothetical protein QBC38DRAFT_536502 [Podospora fimiseda]
MADLTSTFNSLLKSHESPPTKQFLPPETIPDEFLKEAYRINSLISRLHSELLCLRQSYLSTASSSHPRKSRLNNHHPSQQVLTDRDREEIDANAKSTLRDLNARIRSLEDAEQLRQSTQSALLTKKFSSIFSKSKKSSQQIQAESSLRQLNAHRESVIYYLRTKLQETAKTQQKMMETRLTREMEKNRSVLAKTRSANGWNTTLPEDMDEKKKLPVVVQDDDLTPEQKQLFEKGNQDMLKHFESTLDKVRTAEKSLLEISELQNLLVGNLTTQSAHIDQLVAESFDTTEGIGKGNKELKKSTERSSPARYTFFAAAGLSAFLIVWDLLI